MVDTAKIETTTKPWLADVHQSKITFRILTPTWLRTGSVTGAFDCLQSSIFRRGSSDFKMKQAMHRIVKIFGYGLDILELRNRRVNQEPPTSDNAPTLAPRERLLYQEKRTLQLHTWKVATPLGRLGQNLLVDGQCTWKKLDSNMTNASRMGERGRTPDDTEVKFLSNQATNKQTPFLFAS